MKTIHEAQRPCCRRPEPFPLPNRGRMCWSHATSPRHPTPTQWARTRCPPWQMLTPKLAQLPASVPLMSRWNWRKQSRMSTPAGAASKPHHPVSTLASKPTRRRPRRRALQRRTVEESADEAWPSETKRTMRRSVDMPTEWGLPPERPPPDAAMPRQQPYISAVCDPCATAPLAPHGYGWVSGCPLGSARTRCSPLWSDQAEDGGDVATVLVAPCEGCCPPPSVRPAGLATRWSRTGDGRIDGRRSNVAVRPRCSPGRRLRHLRRGPRRPSLAGLAGGTPPAAMTSQQVLD